MGFMGRLGDMPFEDIVQMLSMSQRTGRLTLTHAASKAVILFKHGEIVGASCDAVNDSLGQALLARKAVSESALAVALEVQQRAVPARLLGSILVEMNAVRPETVEEVVRKQVQKVIDEIVRWTDGAFRFERLEHPEYLAAGFADSEMLLRSGLRADQVMLDAARRLDEIEPGEEREPPPILSFPHRAKSVPASASKRVTVDMGDTLTANQIIAALTEGDAGEEPAAEAPAVEATAAIGSEVSFLKSIIDETRSSDFVGEIGLMIMRCGARLVRRGVLFSVSHGQVRGIGEFGLELSGPRAYEKVRKMRIPLVDPSVFRTVVESGRSSRGRLAKTFWDEYLVRQLGGEEPDEVIAVPMSVGGNVVSIFYGDNVPAKGGIGSIEMIELLMLYASLGMERMLRAAKTGR
ncbi:MAG TPA: DUF4388 domain-containing protein [Thermoanaerobaculaceae bacterium]|nr:DUF4388 domain-containing protein [Thermoanaerobaculaceae bacterium]